MVKRLLWLGGLAILAVVLNHAAAWGQISMVWWTNRYLPVTVPNFSQVGTPPYHFYLVLREITEFSVPAFLFISAYFATYSLRGKDFSDTRKILSRILTNLIIPYLIWSGFAIGLQLMTNVVSTPGDYLSELFFSGVESLYYFIPVLCSLYLLSPLFIWLARKNLPALFAGVGIIHFGLIAVSYLHAFKIGGSTVAFIDTTLSDTTFPRYILYFVLGVTAGLYMDAFRNFLMRFRVGFLPLAVVFAALKIFEAGYRFDSGLTGIPETGSSTITMTLYSFSMIFLLLSGDVLKPFSKVFNFLGSRSYGIYLSHYLVIVYLGKVIYHFVPQLLAHQFLLFTVFVAFGLSVPVAFIAIARRIPAAKKMLVYVFG